MAIAEKNYQFFDIRVLFKNRVALLSIVFTAPIIGFVLPTDLYKLLNRGVISGKVPILWLILAVIFLFLINIFIIRIILLTKYAIKNQATIAGPVIYLVTAGMAFAGIWFRLYLVYIIPDASTVLSPTMASTPHSPLSFWPAAVSVAIILSLFSTVYGLVSEPYSKVDYSGFHSSIDRFFNYVQQIQIKRSEEPGTPLDKEYSAIIRKTVKELVSLLQAEADKEKDYYAVFLRVSLLPQVKNIQEFVSLAEFEDTPQLIFQLSLKKDNDIIPWIIEKGYLESYTTLASYSNRRLK